LDRGRVIANGTREELVQMATKTERAVLTLKGDRETLESSLESLKEVEEVRFEGYRQGGYARFLLRAPTGTPLIPLLNDFIRQNNLEVKELSREEPTLEETFIWLLSRDKSRQR